MTSGHTKHCCSVVKSCLTLWTAECQVPLFSAIFWSLLKFMSIIESVMPSNHFILCQSLLLLPSIFPSSSVFSSELVLRIRGPKYWSFSFSISPSNARLNSPKISLISLQSKGLSESSPAPQFESINFLALSLLYGPTLISTHNYWKVHSFDHTHLC